MTVGTENADRQPLQPAATCIKLEKMIENEIEGRAMVLAGFKERNMKSKGLKSLVAVAAIIALGSVKVQANSVLELISGSTTETVTTTDGVAIYQGAVGGWSINVTTGLAAPADGQAADSIDVDSVDFSAGGTSSSLTILWSSTGYTANGAAVAAIGGTSSTGLSFTTFYGPSVLSTANTLTSKMTFGKGAFSGSGTGTITTGSPYALTEEVVLTGGKVGTMLSFDAGVTVIPNPTPTPDGGSSMILLGGAITALAAIRSRIGKK